MTDPNLFDRPGGVWVAFGYDTTAYVHGIFPNEVEALRCAVNNYGDAIWVPFGISLQEAIAARNSGGQRG